MNKNSDLSDRILFVPSEEKELAEEEASYIPKRRGRKRSLETEKRPLITYDQMKDILEDIHEITTPTGIKYIDLRLTKRMIIGVRESSGKEFTINLDELYEAYQKCLRFTSPEVKRYIFMGHSPAVVLLKEIKEKAM